MRILPLERFITKVNFSDTLDRCWVWVAGKNKDGYGQFHVGGKQHGSHRWIYETIFGSIEDNLVIDHTCENPSCVNPFHLEPVTVSVNALRKMDRRGTCSRGHDISDGNFLYTKKGHRVCKTCKSEYGKTYKASKKALVREHPKEVNR